MTTTDFLTDLRERMAADGFITPDSWNTWEGVMQAVVMGAIDADDLQATLTECARIVDGQLDKQKVKRLFSWHEIASRFYEEIIKHDDREKELREDIVRMGQCADAILRGEVHSN